MGRFVLGVFIGAGVSAAAVILLARRSGKENRQSLTERLQVAMQAGVQAAEQQEQALWQEYRKKLETPVGGKPNPSFPPLYT